MGRAGRQGLEYLDLEHPYAADLDLFGEGSLFERLCTARTRAGEETLASWLSRRRRPRRSASGSGRRRAPPPARPARGPRAPGRRGPRRDRSGGPGRLGTSQREFPGKTVLVVATILGALGTAAVVGWLFLDIGLLPLLVVLVLDAAFART